MNTSIIYYLVFRFFVIFHTSSAHMGLCSVDGCSGRTIFIELSAEGMVSSSTGRVLYRHDHALLAARPSAVSLHPRFSRAAFFRGCPVPAAALAREGRIEAIFPCAKACMLRASFLFPILLNISVSE